MECRLLNFPCKQRAVGVVGDPQPGLGIDCVAGLSGSVKRARRF